MSPRDDRSSYHLFAGKGRTGSWSVLNRPAGHRDRRCSWVVKLDVVVRVSRSRVTAAAVHLTNSDVIRNDWQDTQQDVGVRGPTFSIGDTYRQRLHTRWIISRDTCCVSENAS